MPHATLATICAACKQPGSIEVSQEIRDNRLRWSEQFACACGHGFGAGDVGLPPDGVRQALLKANGTVTLWLDDSAHRDAAKRVLLKLLTLSEAEVDAALAQVPAKLYSGTAVEADFLEQGLTKVGVSGVRRVTG